MPLDLPSLHPQLQEMAARLAESRGDFAQRLGNAVAAAERTAGSRWQALQERITLHRGRYTWLVPDLTEPLTASYDPPAPPAELAVLAVDGSQVEVERDAPAACFLLNIGRVTLRYGAQPEARLESMPSLRFGDGGLVLRDPQNGTREQMVDNVILNALRATAEVQALADLAAALPPDLPAIALLDGTLVLWGLAGQGYPAFVRERLLGDYLTALEALRRLAAERPLALASYISLPRATEAVNALRIALCPYPAPDCDRYCAAAPPLQRGCDAVARVRDRDLFARLLQPGQRSALLESRSSVVGQSYGAHAVSFFYLHAGAETARVELPVWSRPRLDLLHAALGAQVQLGRGYPLALAEAHEQAVVRAADRDLFWQLVESAVTGERVAPPASQKSLAKRRRWV